VPTVMWFRRDLRRRDNPALAEAATASDGGVVPLFVLDPALWRPAGGTRQTYLLRSVRALDADLGGHLVVRRGDPVDEVVQVARSTGAGRVHMAADHGPYGRVRDERVEAALRDADIELIITGSSYAVAPGRVTKDDGTPYSVFTPFFKAWLAHGWRQPAQMPSRVTWAAVERPDLDGALQAEPIGAADDLPAAGERAALRAWERWRDDHLADYHEERDRPDLDMSSRLSVPLKYGEIHPRTILADLAHRSGKGPDALRRQLAWREFYAHLLWHHPESAREYLKPDQAPKQYDIGAEADRLFEAWCSGRTGYPIIDAGMRQLLGEGWVHNRVRLLVASFLTKDLHQDWRRGARYFMSRLVDGDLASNNHNWQWVAGTGADAAPYYRVFNPVLQGKKFDPDGAYVRRWVPELRGISGPAVHEPWTLPAGVPEGYPEPIVDHRAEREEALRRFADR
jgi:deoxyribodipyrimidine photo-lyase